MPKMTWFADADAGAPTNGNGTLRIDELGSKLEAMNSDENKFIVPKRLIGKLALRMSTPTDADFPFAGKLFIVLHRGTYTGQDTSESIFEKILDDAYAVRIKVAGLQDFQHISNNVAKVSFAHTFTKEQKDVLLSHQSEATDKPKCDLVVVYGSVMTPSSVKLAGTLTVVYSTEGGQAF